MNAISGSTSTFFNGNANVAEIAMRGRNFVTEQGNRAGFQQAFSGNQQQLQQVIPLVNKLLQQVQTGKASSAVNSTTLTDNASTSTPGSGLTEEQADTLTYTREEEKLARDVYKTLGDMWGIKSFDNIANSEQQQHMDSMAQQLENYGLEDPVKDDAVGVFTNPELADLYQQLVGRGSQSVQEALQVGAYIEELDMLDLQQAIDEAGQQPGLVSAYENLLKGSRNHMRSFVGQIESQGVDYQAQLLSQAEVDQITDSAIESGNVNGNGRRGGAV